MDNTWKLFLITFFKLIDSSIFNRFIATNKLIIMLKSEIVGSCFWTKQSEINQVVIFELR